MITPASCRHRLRCTFSVPLCLGLALGALSCMPSLVLRGLEAGVGDWNMARGGPACQGVRVDGPAPPLALKWKHGTKAAIESAPVIAGRVLVVGDLAGEVLALRCADGSKQGSYRVDGAISSSLAVSGRYLFIATQGERHTFRALDLHTGKVRWERQIGDVAASPTVAGNRVCVGTQNGTLFAFDAERGDTLWTFAAGDQIHGSAAVCDTLLCVGSVDHFLYALSADSGRLVWKVDVGAGIYAAPALWDDRAFLGAADGAFRCLDARDGTVLWTFQADGPIHSSPAIASDRVYLGCYGGAIYSVSASTGELLWRFDTGGAVIASPVVTRDVLYVGSSDGVFYALDAQTGSELWRYETKGPIEASAALDEHGVYVGSTDRFVYAFGPR